ncbi:MAG: GNAT family protein [Pyrinomonadaceae bacterium]
MFITYKVDDEIKLVYPFEIYASELHAVVAESNDYLSEWLPWAIKDFSLDNALSQIRYMNEACSKNQSLWTLIKYKGAVVGGIGLNRFDPGSMTTDIGYWLEEKSQHKGIITRACAAMIEYTFADLGFNRIELRTAAENKRSVAVAERLGFVHEGTLRQAEVLHNVFRSLELYALVKEDWLKSQQGIAD